MNKNFWIITEVFYPDEVATAHILTKISENLSSEYCINVITSCNVYRHSIDNHNSDLKDINITRVYVPNILRINTKILRFLSSIYISFALIIKFLIKIKNNEKVLIVTNPLFLVLFTAFIKNFKKFHLIILVHDVFPENTIPAKILNSKSLVYYLLKKIFDLAYSKADQLIVIGRDMKVIVDQKVKANKSIVIENWVDNDVLKNHISIKPINNEATKFVYAGNLGRVQGILRLVKEFHKYRFNEACLEIWGHGFEECQINQFLSNNFCSNIYFKGIFNRIDQKTINIESDVIVISLIPGMFGLGVPSKFYNSIALGKPILYIGDKYSEIEYLIDKYEFGFFIDSKNIESELPIVVNKICKMSKSDLINIGAKGRKLAEDYYSEEKILLKYKDIL